MPPRKCVICGREFVPHNPKQKMCDREHWHPCPNCGKPVLTKSPSEVNKCCCRKCGQAIAQKKREDNFKAEGVKSLKDIQEKKTYRKVCKYCGKPFETHNARQVYCGNDYYNCPVCGKRVKINKDRSNIGAACSKECRQIRIEQTNLKKYGSKHSVTSENAKKLSIEHNLEKYGTEYPMQSESVKSKYVSTMNERYGVSYPIQNDEIKKKIQDTNVSKYGFISPMQNDKVKSKARETLEEKYGGVGLCSQEIRDKAKATNLERYGFDNPWKNKSVREKISKTNKARYGDTIPSRTQSVKEKTKATSISKYGFDNPMKSNSILNRAKQASLAKYGFDNPAKSEVSKAHSKQTFIEHYGVDNPMKDELVKAKASNTNYKKYGSSSWLSSIYRYTKTSNDKNKSNEWIKFKENTAEYLESIPFEDRTYSHLSDIFGVTVSPICALVKDKKLEEMMNLRHSNIENEVYNFVSSVYSGKINRNDRNQIKPLELDLYFPDLLFAIEVNPTYTHNSTIPAFGSDSVIPNNYHFEKYTKCSNAGIRLFNVWSYDWKYKNKIVKSMISEQLNSNSLKRVYARNTVFKLISFKEASRFLNENHLKGSCISKYQFGLFSNNELISVMTFGRLRSTQGKTEENNVELSRFCSKQGYSVIGGASKLFKNALKYISEYEKVISFSDVATTSGNLYSVLGFHATNRAKPGYTWVSLSTDIPVNRVNAQKKSLKKFLKDDSIDLSKTEKQIMIEHGFVQVFDCGTIRWEYQL